MGSRQKKAAFSTPFHLQYFRFFEKPLLFFDDEGRPLREAHAREAGVEGIEWEFKRCPYSGKVHGKLMNAAALKQMRRHWSLYLDGLSTMRQKWLASDPTPTDTIEGLWRLAGAITNIPHYAFLRAHNPIQDRAFPAHVASMFKAALDVFSTAELMLVQRMAEPEYCAGTQVPTPEIGKYADANDLFLNSEWVCAASPAMVDETVEVLRVGRPGADPKLLDEIIPDFDLYAAYTRAMLSQYLLGLVFCRVTEVAIESMATTMGSADSSVRSWAGDHAQHTRARRMAQCFTMPSTRERVLDRLETLLGTLLPCEMVSAGAFFTAAKALAEEEPPTRKDWVRLPTALAETPGVPAPEHSRVVSILCQLATYLEIEKQFFSTLGTITMRIDELLGRQWHDRRSEVLEHVVTPRDLVSEVFHLHIEPTSQGYLIQKNGVRFEV